MVSFIITYGGYKRGYNIGEKVQLGNSILVRFRVTSSFLNGAKNGGKDDMADIVHNGNSFCLITPTEK